LNILSLIIKNLLLYLFIMIDIVDLFHYLVGIIIVSFLIWVLIKVHLYFSQNNKSLEEIMNIKIT
jgi:hypothetical protein